MSTEVRRSATGVSSTLPEALANERNPETQVSSRAHVRNLVSVFVNICIPVNDIL